MEIALDAPSRRVCEASFNARNESLLPALIKGNQLNSTSKRHDKHFANLATRAKVLLNFDCYAPVPLKIVAIFISQSLTGSPISSCKVFAHFLQNATCISGAAYKLDCFIDVNLLRNNLQDNGTSINIASMISVKILTQILPCQLHSIT